MGRADRSTQLVIGADIAIRDPPGMAPDRLLDRWSCQPIIRLLARDRVIRATRRESNRRHPPPPPSRSTDRPTDAPSEYLARVQVQGEKRRGEKRDMCPINLTCQSYQEMPTAAV